LDELKKSEEDLDAVTTSLSSQTAAASFENPISIHVSTATDGLQTLHIGDVNAPVRRGSGALVPNVRFYDNPHHAHIMQEMVRSKMLIR
jgi:hypothetical protein